MVKDLQHAQNIQFARVAQGKKGFAHAVRRWMKSKSKRLQGGGFDWYAYNELKQKLVYLAFEKGEQQDATA